MLASKCASRHNGVHFFDISTSKSALNPSVFLPFWLRNVLRAINGVQFFDTATSKSGPTLVCFNVFYTFLAWKRASRHNSLQLFISHLASWLRTRGFSEPTFRPSGATNHWKKQCFATFLPFRAPGSSFFFSSLLFSSLLFSSLTLPISAFHLSILSEVWLLNFLRSYIYQERSLLISQDPLHVDVLLELSTGQVVAIRGHGNHLLQPEP